MLQIQLVSLSNFGELADKMQLKAFRYCDIL